MALSEEQVEQAAAILLQARARGERLSRWPADLWPTTQDDAEAICERMAAGFEQPIGGWKIGAMNPDSPAKHGLVRPFRGQIPASLIYPSGTRLSWASLQRPVVEAEIVFRLSCDVPARLDPYSMADVAHCIEAAFPGIEIPESRLVDGHPLGALGMVADQGYAGRLVIGEAFRDWRDLDLAAEQACLRVNGEERASGAGARAMGHPLLALTWLANCHRGRAGGLRRGQVISTGSLTGIQHTRPGDEVLVSFLHLGSVSLTMY